MTTPTDEILDNKKVRVTAVRILVLEVFLQKQEALSLQDIEDELPLTDRISIYRSLKTFEKNGIIHEVNDQSKSVRYALCSQKCDKYHHDVHPHFKCDKCDKTICLENQPIVLNHIPKGFEVKTYSLVVTGICADCKNAI